jgi:uncharacterized protein (DUF433 family)
MTLQQRIVRDPAICAGKPIIRGTRVLVRIILGYLAHGETIATIRREFPSVSDEDVRAVIALPPRRRRKTYPPPRLCLLRVGREAEARREPAGIGRPAAGRAQL